MHANKFYLFESNAFDTAYWNANPVERKKNLHMKFKFAISIPNSVLAVARENVVWFREAHDGSYSIQRFAIALKYWNCSHLIPSVERKHQSRNGSECVVFAHCTCDSIIRSIWFVRFLHWHEKMDGREEKKKKVMAVHSNGVDLWMLRLLTMPIVASTVVPALSHPCDAVHQESFKIKHPKVWLCVVCM